MAGSLVQQVSAGAAASGTTIASGAMASDGTAGNYLWVNTSGEGGVTTVTITNTGTATLGTVTEQGSVLEPAITAERTSLTIPITGTGTVNLTCTFGAARTTRLIYVYEITGVAAIATDGTATDEQTDTGTNPTATSTVNVAAQPAFGLQMCIDYQGGTPTVGTGWTDGGTVTLFATIKNRLQTKAITSTGNVTGNFVNAGFDRNTTAMAVFPNAAGGVPPLTATIVRSFARPRAANY